MWSLCATLDEGSVDGWTDQAAGSGRCPNEWTGMGSMFDDVLVTNEVGQKSGANCCYAFSFGDAGSEKLLGAEMDGGDRWQLQRHHRIKFTLN